MDPLSVTASIIAIVQVSSVVIKGIKGLKDTSTDRTQCSNEISNLSVLLVRLMHRLDEASTNDIWHTEVRLLTATDGPIHQYKSALEQLQSKFTSSASSKIKIVGTFRWIFIKEDVANILTCIERLKSLTQIVLQMDSL